MENSWTKATHEQLLEHQEFLMRLARGLVLDGQHADDLVQQVWLTGLQRPPRHGANVRAWLARVLVNRARSEHRSEQRRMRREEEVARPEATPAHSGAQAVARIETQRKLLDALSGLPDPTRTVMVLRYFEGLSAPAIARQLDRSINTVKSQLRRGLEAMRRDLDHDHGGERSSWMLALAPITALADVAPGVSGGATVGSASAPWIGALIMTTSAKWAAATVLIAAIGITLWSRGGDAEFSRAVGSLASQATPTPVPSLRGDAELPRPPDAGGARRTATDAVPQVTVPSVRPPALPALIVRDGPTGEGIKEFTLISRDLRTDSVRDMGTFQTADGRLTAADEPGLSHYPTVLRRFTVWAPGYEPRIVDEHDFGRRSEVLVELLPGDVPKVSGVVMNRGLPVPNAEVSLCSYSRFNWTPTQLKPLIEGRSDRRGGFELGAAAGHYVLRVACDAGTVFRPIELPMLDDLTIELGDLGTVSVEVRDTEGGALPDIVCILRTVGGDSRDLRLETNDLGRAVFRDLEPGAFRAALHGTYAAFLSSPSDERTFSVEPGQDVALVFTAPGPDERRRARLVVEGGTPGGWHAQAVYSEDWIPAAADGGLDIDLSNGSWVKLRSPKGAVWRWTVPPFEPGEGVIDIRIPATPFTYRGRVLSRVTGEPMGNVDVVRRPQSEGAAHLSVSVPTGADGRFVLPLENDVSTSLSFRIDGVSGPHAFTPQHAPSACAPLEIRIFDITTYRTDRHIRLASVSGRVTEAENGQPVADAHVVVSAYYDDPQGLYWVSVDSAWTKSDASGAYSLRVPVAHHYDVHVRDRWTQDARMSEMKKGPLAEGVEAVWDLVLR